MSSGCTCESQTDGKKRKNTERKHEHLHDEVMFPTFFLAIFSTKHNYILKKQSKLHQVSATAFSEI